MNNEYRDEIKKVALYVRKSRGDEEEALSKHKNELISLAEKMDWDYQIYSEIGSGDSLDSRPKMRELLKEVEDNKYEAVCVYDYDRLGRGDLGDQDRLIKTFKKTNTKIITVNPFKIFNLSNEQDEQYTDFHSFIARQEYKMIKKRLKQGKEISAMMGNWTNGTPPLPYEYDRNTKSLNVNQEKLKIYRHVVESFMQGYSLHKIAKDLNNQEIASPKNKTWYSQTVKRLLTDETHLGKIVINKTKSHKSLNANQKNSVEYIDRDKWVSTNGNHKPVKTEEEHYFITRKLAKNKPKGKSVYPLSGLIKCDKCSKNMTFTRHKNIVRLKSCANIINGKRCGNIGGDLNVLYQELYRQLYDYLCHIENKLQNEDFSIQKRSLVEEIQQMRENLKENNIVLNRIQKAYETGGYEVEEFLKRQNSVVLENNKLKEEINTLELKISKLSAEDYIKYIENLKKKLFQINKEDITNKEKNNFYKSIVESIKWKREERATLVLTMRFNYMKNF